MTSEEHSYIIVLFNKYFLKYWWLLMDFFTHKKTSFRERREAIDQRKKEKDRDLIP